MKKILALFLSAFLAIQSAPLTFALETDNSASPWTAVKAEHLARRALTHVTPEIIQQLTEAGSAEAAVELIFTPPSASAQNSFVQETNAFLQGKSVTSTDDMEALYLFELYRDPFDAKRKLFTLLEDIFSVARTDSKQITYSNIRNWHRKIYQYTLGNYKDLTYQSIYDYAPTKYLDLLNVNRNNPNENFARELLQLFLMEEYLPLDVNREGQRNYSEDDVAALAKILTGFTSTDNVTVTYNSANHNNSAQTFLGASYPNTASDPARVVDYIFEKKGNNIAQFIVWRLYKFYIAESMTQTDLNQFVRVFEQNNFEILPTVKAILTSNQMYSSTSMNEIRYKNPLELAVGTQSILQQKNPKVLDSIPARAASSLNFSPYNVPSIFGRPGMDVNAEWINSFVQNQWLQLAPKYVFRTSNAWSVVDFIPEAPTVSESIFSEEVIEVQSAPAESVSIPETPVSTPESTSTENTSNTTNTTEESSSNEPAQETPPPAPVSENPSTPTPETSPENENNSPSSPENTESDIIPTTPQEVSPTPVTEAPIAPESVSTPETPAPVVEQASENILFRFFRKKKSPKISWLDMFVPSASAAGLISPMDLIQNLEKKLYISRTLPDSVRDQLINYLTKENNATILFEPESPSYQNTKIKGLIALMLIQPEFLLQSGYDQNLAITDSSSGSGRFGNKGSLVLVSLPGGADWLQIVNPFDATYRQFRGTLALTETEILDLDRGLKLNKVFEAMYPRYASGQLRLVNNVGLPNHSRSHSEARTQMETGLLNGFGAMGKGFSQDTSGTTNQISLFSGIPQVFAGAPAIAIGNASTQISSPQGLSSQQGSEFLSTFKTIAETRRFPGDTGLKIRDALKLDTIGRTAGTPGNQNDTQFNYIKNLINSNIGKVYYVNANGGYDTHGNQKAGMNTNLRNLSTRMEAFFADMTAQGKEVTMVVFSEFGRTNRVNGSVGTDHGEGGGMIVLSNKDSLRIPKLAGNIDLASEKQNWLSPKIDVRAMWNTLMQDLFGIDISQTFPVNPRTNKVFSMVDYTAEAAPYVTNIQENFINNENVQINFQVQDNESDFNPAGVSKVRIFFGSDTNNLVEGFITTTNNGYQSMLTIVPGQEYFYKILVNDENYNERSFEKSLISPRPTGANGALPNGMNAPYKFTLPTSLQEKPLPLAVGMTTLKDPAGKGVQVVLQPGTLVTGIASTGSSTPSWNGQFQPPSLLTIGSGESYNNQSVVGKMHVGPSSSDSRLILTKNFLVSLPVNTTAQFVHVYHSFDGASWTNIKDAALVSSGVVLFSANDFGYFLLTENTETSLEVIPTGNSSSGGSGSSESSSMNNASTGSGSSSQNTSSSMGTSSTMNSQTSNSSSITSSPSSSSTSASSSASGGGSSGGFSIMTGSYILPTVAKNISTTQSVVLEKSQGKFLGDTEIQGKGLSLFIPKNSQVSQLQNSTFTGTFQAPHKLSAFKKPLATEPGKELLILSAGAATDQDLKLSEEATLTIDLSSFNIDWERETVKIFYFDTNEKKYKLVKDGGFISADKKTISVNTKYVNVWGIFAIKK